jgi:hypothetical protein
MPSRCGRFPRPPAGSVRPETLALAGVVTASLLLLAFGLPFGATTGMAGSAQSIHQDAGPVPAANFSIPAIGANTTGFAVSTTELSLGGNRGLRTTAAVPPLPANLSANATLVLAVGEPINSTVTAFVGFVEGQAFGLSAAVPFSYVNDSGTITVGTGPYLLPPGATFHTFSFHEVHGPWWTFSVDGTLLTGGPESQGNGTFDLGSSSAAGFGVTIPPTPALAFVVTGDHSPAPSLSLPEALSFLGPSGWVNATSADAILDQGVGLAGYLQDPFIPPGALAVGGNLSTLPPLTPLWDTGPLPQLSLNVTGLAAASPAGGGITLHAWVNSTDGTGVAASLNLSDSLGALTRVSPGGIPGTFLVTFQPAGVPIPTPDTLTFRAVAPGFVGTTLQEQTTITPSNVSVRGPPGAQGVLSGGTLLLPFTLQNAQGGPWIPSSTTVTVSPPEGSAEALLAATTGSPDVVVLYEAPVVEAPTGVNVTLSAVAPGFPTASATAAVQVLPRPLALQAPMVPVLSPGQTFVLRMGVVGPGLGPGPLDNGTWTVVGAGTTKGGVDLGPFQGLGYGNVSAPLHVRSNFTGSVDLEVLLAIPGYAPASVTLPITVLANATLVPERAPLSLAAGSQGLVVVEVNAPLPLVNGTVLLTASDGNWLGGSGGRLVLSVPANGSVRAVLDAPLSLTTTQVTVQVTLQAVGFHPVSIGWGVTVHPSWQSFFGQVWAYPLLLAVVAGLVLLGVWSYRRRRVQGASPLPPPVREGGSGPEPSVPRTTPEYAEDEGSGPHPPP